MRHERRTEIDVDARAETVRSIVTPPAMAGWNLALRFGLELGVLAGLGAAAWSATSGPTRWAAVTILPGIAASIWGVFNVLDDPSRSGAAVVEVRGSVRLAIELLALGGGAVAISFAGRRDLGIAFVLLVVLHEVASISRLEWLVRIDGRLAAESSSSIVPRSGPRPFVIRRRPRASRRVVS